MSRQPVPADPARCAVCSHPAGSRYCPDCGARRPAPSDESLVHFLREQFQEVTSADGKLWRTLTALFVPGKLTAEYFSGRREMYVRPVRIFLVLNLVFFFVLAGANGSFFRGPLSSHFEDEMYGVVARRLTEAQRARWDVTPETYEAAFNARADALAPSLIGLLVPVLALLFALVLAPVKPRGLRHVVLASHAVAFFMAGLLALLAVLSVVLGVMSALTGGGRGDRGVDAVLVPMLLVAIVAYLVVAVRRVYEIGWIYASLAGTLLATVGLWVALIAFRAGLFFATHWTLNPPGTT